MYKRKNSAANNAARGLAQGFGQGIALGQRSRALTEDERQGEFHRQQVLRQARIADEELQREAGARDAASEAVGELTDEPERLQGGGGAITAPGVLAAQATVAQDATTQRIGTIAQKMAKMGVPMRDVQSFLDLSKAKYIEADDKARRKVLTEQIVNAVKGDTLFGTQHDGKRVSNPETEKAAQHLLEMASNPNVPLEALRSGLVGLKRGVSSDRTRIAHRQSLVQTLDEDLANTIAQSAAMSASMTPAMRNATSEQMRRLQTLRDQFDVFYDEITGTKGGEMAFQQQWNNAKNGIAFVNPRTGDPVSFAEAATVKKYEMLLREQELRTKAAEQAVHEARAKREMAGIGNDATRAAAVPVEAEAKRMSAEAALNRSRKPTNTDNRDDARLKAHPLFKDGVPGWAFKNPELVDILETYPPEVLKLGAESAKKFHDALLDVPYEKRDAFLEEWVDEDGDVDVVEWLKEN